MTQTYIAPGSLAAKELSQRIAALTPQESLALDRFLEGLNAHHPERDDHTPMDQIPFRIHEWVTTLKGGN